MQFVEFLPNLSSKTIFKPKSICKVKSDHENLSNSKIDFDSFTSINCSSCQNLLLFNNLEIKNAPSEYWYDLLDCWACHDEDYNSKLKGHKNGKILAKKGILLLSDSKLLIHKTDFQENCLTVSY
jgi:hypothetical protein